MARDDQGRYQRLLDSTRGPEHTRRWLDVQAANHARVSASWAAKDMAGRRLLDVQEEHGSLFAAQQLLAGGVA